jgi:hypothetical protein
MKLNAPTRIIWIISLILGIVALILYITGQGLFGFIAAIIGLVLLLLATLLKGM